MTSSRLRTVLFSVFAALTFASAAEANKGDGRLVPIRRPGRVVTTEPTDRPGLRRAPRVAQQSQPRSTHRRNAPRVVPQTPATHAWDMTGSQ